MRDVTVSHHELDATHRYIIAGWFADHDCDLVRAAHSPAGAVWLYPDPVAELSADSMYSRIILREEFRADSFGEVPLDRVEDAAVLDGALVLTFGNGDSLKLTWSE